MKGQGETSLPFFENEINNCGFAFRRRFFQTVRKPATSVTW